MATQRTYKKELTRGQKFLRGLLVVLLVALLGLAGYSQYVGDTMLPENIMVSVITPIQGVVSNTALAINQYLAKVKLRSNIEMEYNKIKAQNDQLMYDALLVEELQNENERLRLLLGVYEANASMDPLMAKVISSESGNWFSTFTLNKGTAHGVDVNMAVINASGLIGHVYEVFATSCKVITIIDSKSKIAAIIESSRDQGSLQGTLGIDGTPMCRMYYLPASSIPRPGDNVVTSGIGLPFPKGLKMGVIRESARSLDENKYYIVVEPVADFRHIEEVLILRYKPAVQAMPDVVDAEAIDVQHVPTARPMATISTEQLDATPPPLPGAPGRKEAGTPVPSLLPGQTPPPSAGAATSGENTQDDDIQRQVDAFNNE